MSENIGRRAAHLHWHEGLSWNEVAHQLGANRERARSAARHYKQNHPDEFADPDLEQVTQDQHRNTATVESKSARIKTLDQLLEACEVDLETWRVDHYLINKWEVGAKSEWKDLHYEDGKASGDVRSEGLQIEPLFQVKAWLIRRKPEPIFPTIQPIECNLSFEIPPEPERKGIRRSLIWADSQVGFRRDLRTGVLVPFHDLRAMDVALQIMAAAEPDRVDGLGDSGDWTVWTDRFVREPEFAHTTQPMILVLHWFLAQIRLTVGSDVPVRLHEGNHDLRINEYIAVHLREAHELRAADEMDLPPAMSVQRLLALHKLGIEWIGGYPDDEDWLNDHICLAHGDTARSPGNTAKAITGETDCVKIVGHVHRAEMAIRTVHTRDGNKTALCCCVPCLCKANGEVPGSDNRDDWQNGIAIVDYEADGTGYSIDMIPIVDGVAIWNGQRFEGRDRLEDLRKDLPGWQWQ